MQDNPASFEYEGVQSFQYHLNQTEHVSQRAQMIVLNLGAALLDLTVSHTTLTSFESSSQNFFISSATSHARY